MVEELKYLLIRDLCARIPYGVKYITYLGDVFTLKSFDLGKTTLHYVDDCWTLSEITPYLRPISSMTKKEKKEYDKLRMSFYKNAKDASLVLIDWLNAHHFDYRGLIEKGLALDAPEGMYQIQ